MLWIRRLDAIEARPLSGTEGAQTPFWSPDGRFVAFFSAGKLKKIPVSGGASITLCDAETVPAGGAWNVEDVILFAGVSGGPGGGVPKPNPIRRVSASGGAPEAVTTPDTAKGEPWHLWPSFLPDGRHFVYFASGFRDPKAIYVGSLDSEDSNALVQEGPMRSMPADRLLFLRGTTLLAQAFDTKRLELAGEAVTIADSRGSVARLERPGRFQRRPLRCCIKRVRMHRGLPGSTVRANQWWLVSREATTTSVSHPGAPGSPWVLPIGHSDATSGLSTRRVALHTIDVRCGRLVMRRFWLPDGSRIVFNSDRQGQFDLKRSVPTLREQKRCSLKTTLRSSPCRGPRTGATFCINPAAATTPRAFTCGCSR